MHCLSISYKKTPLEVRESFAFTLEEKIKFENKAIHGLVRGCIIVSTCNRTEIYFSGKKESIDEMEHIFANEKSFSYKDLKKFINVYSNDGAIRHLCQVICGIDSMVVGEDEILRQVKEAYTNSLENKTTNYELNIIFQSALNIAKSIKTNTKISTTPISIATLTINEIIKFIKDKVEGKILIVGATGKMGSLIAKYLLEKENIQLAATTRNLRDEEYGNRNSKIVWVPYEERYQYLLWANVVVSATTSPHYIFTCEEVNKVLETNNTKKLFIDLAVPCDMDKDIGMNENIHRMDIDDFKLLSQENNHIKLKEVEKAKILIEEKVEEIRKTIYYHELLEDIQSIEEVIRKKGFPFILFQLKERLTADEISTLFQSLKVMVRE